MSKRTKAIQDKLLTWYSEHKRILPWRSTKNPYRIWISEIMLQQTQVKTVIPYYRTWMKAFPSLKKLADAPLDQVLKRWEGLGYYTRARNLHKAAKEIVEKHNGRMPRNFDDILALPGIGKYSAGAIASIAFNQKKPILDGNVIRILSRIEAIDKNIELTETKNELWKLAEDLLPEERPGDFNQAMMELGAMLCSPIAPDCNICPVKSSCKAFKLKRQEDFPVRTKSDKPIPIDVAIGIIWHDNEVLIQKRKEDGLMGGLWEFPGGKIEAGEKTEDGLQRELKEELGIETQVLGKRTVINHAYTKYKVKLHAYDCAIKTGKPKAKSATQIKWSSPRNLKDFAFPAANKKLIPDLVNQPLGLI